MRFIDFKAHFGIFRVFSVADIRKWDPGFDTRRLVEWQQKNYILKIVNRWYMFSDIVPDENFLFLAANRIYSPSYVSFESALTYYRLIPEGVYTITSATTLKTQQWTTPIGTFAYRHMKPSLMFGYRLININGQQFKIAEPEKLILDFLYLNTNLQNAEDLEALRINREELEALVRIKRLMETLAIFKNKKLDKRVDMFLKTFKFDIK